MNRLDHPSMPFALELYISPRVVLVVLVIAGMCVHVLDDFVENPKLLPFGLLIYAVAIILWITVDYSAKLTPWLILLALNGLILLSHAWFHVPNILFLLNMMAIIAMVMLGFFGALSMTLLTTGLAIGISWHQPSELAFTELGMLMVTSWMTLGALYLWHRRTLHLARWTWQHYTDAQKLTQRMRDERITHRQLEADLLISNRELARLAGRLKALHQIAEEARQTKEKFVANVSHELRTPLNMIIGFSDIISRSTSVYGIKLPPALLADIAAIRRNSQHLAKLVDDVLDLSQLELGRMALSKDWVSLHDIVRQATTSVDALYLSKKLYLTIDIPDTLPLIFCDATRVRQVLINLLSNAGRFTDEGGVQITVQDDEDIIVVSVSDTGSGITLEDQKRLFEPFYQVDNSLRRRHDGNGLGLSISQQFVKMHQGKMWVESKLGCGTTVHFSLPRQVAPPNLGVVQGTYYNPNAQYEWRTEPSKAPAPHFAPRFVVLEKGKTLSRLFARYRDGIEVSTVQSMDEAIKALQDSPAYALIINASSFVTPLSMVDAEQLGELPNNTPVITCWVADEDMAAQELGVDRYLVKPINCDLLLATLANLEKSLGRSIENILIVDDDREVLQLFARMLASSGRAYRILQATNGRRAMDLLRKRQPDLMLLDLGMPQMNGFQVLEQKRNEAEISKIPVVVISAQDPNGQPIVSHGLSITHSNGLSAANLLQCFQSIGEILLPGLQSVHRGPPKKPIG